MRARIFVGLRCPWCMGGPRLPGGIPASLIAAPRDPDLETTPIGPSKNPRFIQDSYTKDFFADEDYDSIFTRAGPHRSSANKGLLWKWRLRSSGLENPV